MTEKDSPNVIAFPPLVLAAALGLALLMGHVLPLDVLPGGFGHPITLAGGALMAAAAVLGSLGILAFRRAGTNIEPHKPALVLVETGPYRVTRNPMYSALMLGHFGIALAFSLDWAIATLGGLALVLHYGVVLREEAYLARKFHQDYTDYLSRTRRWI